MLLNAGMYRIYIKAMKSIHEFCANYYDMRDKDSGETLGQLNIDLKRREIGFFRQYNRDDSYTFTLLTKMDLNEDFILHTETPIYPDCK